jgi:c-di-GMP-related signal transduction protein
MREKRTKIINVLLTEQEMKQVKEALIQKMGETGELLSMSELLRSAVLWYIRKDRKHEEHNNKD